MAKVTGPLMSMTASGTVGGTITFDKRGFVRSRVIPANPQSETQGNVRQALLAVQKALARLGNTPITALKAIAPISYRWNAFALQAVIGPNSADFDAGRTAYAALGSTAQGHWETSGGTAGLIDQTIAYAGDPAVTAGEALFIVSRGLFGLGLNTGAGTPDATNYAAWETYFAS
jgi:hypothetical protein